ncbi:MAG: ACT domain-containing protein [Lentisphaerales bacterium]|nr:ACT domain-containing protein [Lentisphaerales bacterium]
MPSNKSTSASNAITVRLKLNHTPGLLAKVTAVIGETGGNIGAIDIIRVEGKHIIRDITVDTTDETHAEEICKAIEAVEGVIVQNVSDRTFLLHLGGKIEVTSKSPLKTRDELSMAYTPGVARVCKAIHKKPEDAHRLTIKKNTVAIVSDGTAVLGLGDIGPEAAMPVMEGKAMLFKEFAGVDAFPLCLDTTDTEEIIKVVKAVAPTFGGVNLEDISAPRCFEIEKRLNEELDIPVFHDDQHGTAVVMTAALINALKVVNKKPEDIKVVVAGVGAAGTACTNMMLALGVKNIIGFDRTGALYEGRENMNSAKQEYASCTNPEKLAGKLQEVMVGADLFVGLSGPEIISAEDVSKMTDKAIVFAMSNPTPEIMPEDAYPHVAVMATGRSDYPNQINNVLCFPGIFRGALDCQATDINEEMKVAAAYAIAETIPEDSLCADYIIPSVFDKKVVNKVASAVKKAAQKTGIAKKK